MSKLITEPLLAPDDNRFVMFPIQHDDIYEWIKTNSKYFDLSDSMRIDMKDNTNKKVLGMFKDELTSLPMKEFTALNPKVYSFKNVSHKDFEKGKDNFKKLKGTSKVVVKNDITHGDYNEVLESGESIIPNRDGHSALWTSIHILFDNVDLTLEEIYQIINKEFCELDPEIYKEVIEELKS